jgi:hypothetical protein
VLASRHGVCRAMKIDAHPNLPKAA